MQKTLILIIAFLASINSFSQNKRFEFGYSYNYSIYNEHQNYISNSTTTYSVDKNKMQSKSWSLYFTFKTLKLNRSTFKFGLSFRNSKLIIVDFMDYINHYQSQIYGLEHNSIITITQAKLKDPADLICNSYDFGFNTNYNYKIFSNLKFSGFIGGQIEFYLFQLNSSKYRTSSVSKNEPKQYDLPQWNDPNFYEEGTKIHNSTENFFLKPHRFTKVNSSIYYKHTWERNEKSNISLKLSLGTNIYSCWKQFSKYAWLGLGLEVGIGKMKSQK